MKELEYRNFSGLEVRAAETDRRMTGYAAVFNSDSVDFGWFKERIAPGAFSKSLREKPDVRALVDHDMAKVIGRTSSGTLALREDERGLFAEIDAANTSYGNDVLELVKRGDVDGMSIGFRVMTDRWEMHDGKELRTLLEVQLVEVSVVAFPAYPETSISARSAERDWAERVARHELEHRGMPLQNLKRRIALFEKLI